MLFHLYCFAWLCFTLSKRDNCEYLHTSRIRVVVKIEKIKSVLLIIVSLASSTASNTDWVLDLPNSLIWRIIIQKLLLGREFDPLKILSNCGYILLWKLKNYTWLGIWERIRKSLTPHALVYIFYPYLPVLEIESLILTVSTQSIWTQEPWPLPSCFLHPGIWYVWCLLG